MDPLAGMLPGKDTSLAFMRAAAARGHSLLHCEPRDLSCLGKRVSAHARPIQLVEESAGTAARGGELEHVELTRVDAVFIRKDPPFDAAYLYMTQQLDLAKGHCLVVNDPSAIRRANEKLYALRFEHFMPSTLVSANEEALIEFVSAVGGHAVIKPLDGAGGSGVAKLSIGDANLRPLVGLLTSEGRRLAMVQEFQPAVERGDKRVLLLGGELLGVIRRVPRQGDIRANIHVGGRVEAAELTPPEERLVAEMGPELEGGGLHFVGLDVIDGKLIEVNVTSPTGVQELARLTGADPAARVIEWVERRVRDKKRG